MSWTPEQVKAITHQKENILVSASAGSGKTAVLVERILTLVTDHYVPLSELLVVTFTNAAAQEMRERIAKRLVASRREKPESRAFIDEQLQRLQQANISTLHAFCKELLARHFFTLDIDPNFRIGSAQILELKQMEALEMVFEDQYATSSEAFNHFMSVFSSHRSDEGVKALVLSLYQYSRAYPYPDAWLSTGVSAYHQGVETFDHSPLAMGIKVRTLRLLTALMDQLAMSLDYCQGPGGPGAYAETLRGDLDQFERALCQLTSKPVQEIPWNYLREVVLGIRFDRLKTIRKADKEAVDETVAETIKTLRKAVKNQLGKVADQYFVTPIEGLLSEMGDMAEAVDHLINLVRAFSNQYWSLKTQDQLLDFNDLEQLTIKALHHPEIAGRYRQQFKYIFVDEYQDTNRVQEEIVKLMQGNDNLFQVGDVKQSIYRFRMAEPELFMERFHSYPHLEGSVRIDLNKNFRTHPDILEGVNTVFDGLMTESFGGLAYRTEGRLIAGREDFVGPGKPRVNLVATSAQDEDDDHDIDHDYPETNLLEAQIIHERLMALLQETFYDHHLGIHRRFQVSDVVVLMRSIKGRAQGLRDFLATKGIGVTIDEEDSYFEIVEVATVINCLKVLNNQHQDIPLLGVMRSAIGGFTDAELATIRLYGKDSFYSALNQFVTAMEVGAGFVDVEQFILLRDKAIRFLAMLEGLRRQSHMPTSEFLWHLLTETGYWYFVVGLEDGHYRRQHLEVLMDKARDFELERQSGLHHFVDYLEKMQRAKVSYGGKANSKTERASLRVMSIHKSKGLEFPVVFLAGGGRQFNLQDTRAKVVYHQQYGLGVKWLDLAQRVAKDTLVMAHIKALLTEDTVLEEARILYVALTRAVYRLEVFGGVKDLEGARIKWQQPAKPFDYSQMRTYLDWIMSAISQEETGTSTWEIEHHRLSAKTEETAIEQENITRLLENYALVASAPWPLRDRRVDVLPAKLSVTELKQAGQTLVYIPRITPLSQAFEETHESINRGNAYHIFAERMPLDTTPAQRVMDQLINQGHLTEAQGALMTLDHLQRLRESSFFQRVLKANRVWREHPFVWRKTLDSGESTFIQGVIDLVFLEDDGLVLLDYKSDRLFTGEAFVERYERQLRLYGQALEAMVKIPVKEMAIYAFQIGQWIPIQKEVALDGI